MDSAADWWSRVEGGERCCLDCSACCDRTAPQREVNWMGMAGGGGRHTTSGVRVEDHLHLRSFLEMHC